MSFGGNIAYSLGFNPKYNRSNPHANFQEISRSLDLFMKIHPSLKNQIDQIKTKVARILNNPELSHQFTQNFEKKRDDFIKESIEQDTAYFENLKIFYRHLFEDETFPPQYLLLSFLKDIGNELNSFAGYKFGPQNIEYFFESPLPIEETFERSLHSVRQYLGIVGEIYFYKTCIKHGKMLDKVLGETERYLVYNKENKENIDYWEMRNIYKLAEYKKYIESNGQSEGKIFSLGGSINALAELGIIEKYLENGGKIKAFTGTSMGAILASLLAMKMTGENEHDLEVVQNLQKDISDFSTIGMNDDDSLRLGKSSDKQKIKDFFLSLAYKYEISEKSVFADTSLPVLINTGRHIKNGEQEVWLGGSDKIINSILASTNIGGNLFSDTKIEGQNMFDYSASERNNPIEALKILGIDEKDIVLIDTGSGATDFSNNAFMMNLIRRGFKQSITRDILDKIVLEIGGGEVYDIDTTSFGKLGVNFSLGKNIIKNLVEIGRETYDKKNIKKKVRV